MIFVILFKIPNERLHPLYQDEIIKVIKVTKNDQ